MKTTNEVAGIVMANMTKAIIRLTMGETDAAPIPNEIQEPMDSNDRTRPTASVKVSRSSKNVPTNQ